MSIAWIGGVIAALNPGHKVVRRSVCKVCGWSTAPSQAVRVLRCKKCSSPLTVEEVPE